jgi:hypothetical protein
VGDPGNVGVAGAVTVNPTSRTFEEGKYWPRGRGIGGDRNIRRRRYPRRLAVRRRFRIQSSLDALTRSFRNRLRRRRCRGAPDVSGCGCQRPDTIQG